MLEIPADFEEKYKDSILNFLCERQNQKIKSNSKDAAFEIGNVGLESLLKEINEGPCKESPITKEALSAIQVLWHAIIPALIWKIRFLIVPDIWL